MNDIAIVGAGGLGREIACLINRINSRHPGTWGLIGFFDDNDQIWGTRNDFGEVLGGMERLNAWDSSLSVAVAIGDPSVVQSIIGRIRNSNLSFPNLIDPEVSFMDGDKVAMGEGNVICLRCNISTNVRIGNFNLLNVAAGIGHDVCMGDFNVVMPNVNISGGVRIGSTNLLGVKSTVLQNLKIGDRVKVGAGSLLMRNAQSDSLYFGIPAEKK